LEDLRRERQLEQQRKQEEERKLRQIAALQAAIKAEQEGTAAPDVPGEKAPEAAPAASFDFTKPEEDDEKNPFVMAARESAEEKGEAAGAEKKEDDPFYSGNPSFATGVKAPKGKKAKKPAKPKVDLASLPREHNGIYSALAAGSPVILLLMLLLVCWTPVFLGDLTCPKEVDNLKVLTGVSGLTLMPHAGDLALMPLFAWLSWGISLLPLPMESLQYPLLSWAGAAVCLLGICVMTGCMRLGRHVMFGAGLLLLCLPLFLGMANFIGPVPFACGLSLMAMGLICRGWMKNFDFAGMLLGNLLAAAAVLAGGLYYGIVPVAAGFIFAIWRGNMARLRNTDAVAGLVVFVAAILAWFGCVILFGDSDQGAAVMGALFAAPDTATFIRRLVIALVGFCPFLIIVITVSWPHIIAHSVSNLRASRSENASAYLWVALALAIVCAFFSTQTFDIFLALCIMAVLTARALLSLGLFGTRGFFLLLGLILLAVTLVLATLMIPFVRELVMPLLPPQATACIPAEAMNYLGRFWAADPNVAIGISVAPLVAALIITHVAWRSRTAAAPLLVSAVCVIVLAQPFGLLMPQYAAQVAPDKLVPVAAVLEAGFAPAPAAAAPAEAA
ncbi:MAG: hypothetical protein Q4F72_12470, partial [Desulfovibrionaceae bacterium]|nr:hypothetical protein [Desulfovibrionaceae bacterium]